MNSVRDDDAKDIRAALSYAADTVAHEEIVLSAAG